jgi:hypothetical protein
MNTLPVEATILVAKEEISLLKFPKEDILISIEEKKDRQAKLERALKLGNAYHGKVKIVFEDNQGLKAVETTIWGVTDKNILLKRDVLIPVNRIKEIKF